MTGLAVFTVAHVVVSCLALVTGLVVSMRMLRHEALGAWPRNFFVLSFAASTSGFFFPISDLKPSHIIGILSLLVLGPTLRGYYVAHQHGAWRAIYRMGVIVSTYLLASLAVAQAFMKVAALQSPVIPVTSQTLVAAQCLLWLLALAACARAALLPPSRHHARPLP
jgi:hypothetical protein